MKPVFLGEGSEEDQNPTYWSERAIYWREAATRHKKFLKDHYNLVALGYELLANGKAIQIGNGQVEYEMD